MPGSKRCSASSINRMMTNAWASCRRHLRSPPFRCALATLPEKWLIDGKVVVAEIVGSQSLLEFTIGEASLIAELEGRVTATPGQTMKLGLNLENLLLFDPETEQAIR